MRAGLALVILVVLSVTPASGGNYRWIAPDGSVSYSDQPPPASVSVAPPPSVPVVTSGRPATVEEVLDLSGATRQLGALSASLVAEFKAPPSFSSRERAAVARVADSHFDADRLLRTIVDDLRRGQDQQSLDAVAAWLRSPLGRKITAAEIAASLAPEAERRAGVSGSSAARAALIEQLDWLAGITESQLETIVAITRATATSITEVLPPEQRKSPVEIDRDLQRKRAQLRPQVERATAQFMLYQYRTLEDVELEGLAAFLSSAPGRWYSRAMSRALTQAIGAAASNTARAMIRVVPAERWRELAMAPPPASR
jgi:hypothetical protein